MQLDLDGASNCIEVCETRGGKVHNRKGLLHAQPSSPVQVQSRMTRLGVDEGESRYVIQNGSQTHPQEAVRHRGKGGLSDQKREKQKASRLRRI